MLLAIHQPHYLPWLGYMDKLRRCDVFVFLDNVQFEKNGWQNRNRIKTAQGWQWLTVPVLYRHPMRIEEVPINNKVDWRRKHLMALVTNYSKAPFFKEYLPALEEVLSRPWELLADLNIAISLALMKALGLERRTVRASSFPCRDEPTQRLIDLCLALGAESYLSGPQGRGYMDLGKFEEAGVRVIFQDFRHPVYPQLYGEFIPGLSAVDLLFNCGPESLAILADEGERVR